MTTITVKNRASGKIIKKFFNCGYKVFDGKLHIYKTGQGKGAEPEATYDAKAYTWSTG